MNADLLDMALCVLVLHYVELEISVYFSNINKNQMLDIMPYLCKIFSFHNIGHQVNGEEECRIL